MQIYWNKRKRLHKKRVQLPQDWFGTPIWPPLHCFWTQIWLPCRPCENTLLEDDLSVDTMCCLFYLFLFTLSSVDCSAFFSLSSSNRHFWISSTKASPNWPTARVFSSALVIKPDRNLFLSSSRAILLILSRNDLWATRSSSRFLTLDCVEFKTWGKQQSHEVYFLLALVSTHSC